MDIPTPKPGLVIRYRYLWADEAETGAEEGRKARPCVVIVATRTVRNRVHVAAVPITHTAPSDSNQAIKLTRQTQRRLGLDDDQSWIITDELNEFGWPGPDLEPREDTGQYEYGELPAVVFKAVRDSLVTNLQAGGRSVARTE